MPRLSPLHPWQSMPVLLPLLWALGEAVMEVRAEMAEQDERCVSWDIAEHLDRVGLSQDGDVVIGGLFPVHRQPAVQDLSFTRTPYLPACSKFQGVPLQWAQAMVFAVEEINRDPSLLPGLRLGYRILDSCGRHPFALRGALSMVSGGNRSCRSTGPVRLIIGDASSTQTIILSRTLSPLHVPLVSQTIILSRTLSPLHVPLISYLATCACLSNRREYPNFFRTIPSDVYQARTMAQLAKRFGWTWVGAVANDNEYGRLAVAAFAEEAGDWGVCLAFFETLYRETLARDVDRAASAVQSSSARVVLVFAWYMDVQALLLELVRRNVTDRLFLASEAWSTSGPLLNNAAIRPVARGLLGVAIRNAPMPGFEAHLRGLHPSRLPGDALLRELWEETFGCSPGMEHPSSSTSSSPLLPSCSGRESLEGVQSPFTDTTYLRATYNVYLAVYAAAHALHSLLACPPPGNSSDPNASSQCSPTRNISPAQLLQHLSRVNFTTQIGEEFSFQFSVPSAHQRLGHQVPVSVCSEECPPGTRKARRKGEPVCCFDCLPCTDGEISNTTGSVKCDRCPPEFWSNSHRTECVPREVEFLSFTDTMGIILTTVAVSSAVTTVAVAIVFLYHRHTPIVKANNSELSFLLLLSLKLCFLCSLVFVGRPSLWTCRVQQAAFGISFVLCISCILVKTIVVLAAFRSAMPGSGSVMRWFGPGQQRGSVCLFTCVQVIICAVWLSLSPPSPRHIPGRQGSKVILECTVGSVVGFTCILGYIGLLAAACLLLAFFARKLPDNFNEAKFITFSMLIFCAVWVAFVPAYVSSPGKYTVAVEIFAILASSFGLLVCIFAPKCYIILVRPENNSKKFLMGKTQAKSEQ